MRTLTAFYDLEYGPVSYDFVTWLVRAMHERHRRACGGLHVVVVPKEDGLGGFARHWGKHDEAATRWRLWHIVVAACPLAQATVTIAESRAAARQLPSGPSWYPEGKAHFMGPLVEAGRKGEVIPKLKATAGARRYVEQWRRGRGKYVTMTLRQQETDADRNSNLKAWDELARAMDGSGFEPVILQDSNEELRGSIGNFAVIDPDLRLALYERAEMNFIANNGPQELLKFSDAPYMIFGLGVTEGSREHFRRYFHMQPGDQMPGARKDQRMIYEPDSAAVLVREFKAWASATS